MRYRCKREKIASCSENANLAGNPKFQKIVFTVEDFENGCAQIMVL